MHRSPGSARCAFVVAALLITALPAPRAPASGDGDDVAIRGVERGARTAAEAERAVLSMGPDGARTVLSRTAAWIVVAEHRGGWERMVAPVLRGALGKGGGARALE